MPNQRLQYLFERFTEGNSTPAEKRELFALALDLQQETNVLELLDAYWSSQKIEFTLPDERSEIIAESILNPQTVETEIIQGNVKRMDTKWKWISVAASVVLVIGLGIYFLFFGKFSNPVEIIQSEALRNDVKAPESNRAMITLADGSKIFLDSADNGSLISQSGVNLLKTADGQIVYRLSQGLSKGVSQTGNTAYNTLVNPKGSKVLDMTLADGSRVWLNAGSFITFPVTFIGDERRVNISGEAYFEVVHNASKPFKVTKGDLEVTVLGTHFNVNAYDDEKEIKVTLLEGSVKVSTGNEGRSITSKVIKPGQQAMLADRQIFVVSRVDTEEVMAWKNGLFAFKGANIKPILREVARWYDLEVEFKGEINEKFHIEVRRNTNVSNVFKILETTGGVRFKIEGNKITVIP